MVRADIGGMDVDEQLQDTWTYAGYERSGVGGMRDDYEGWQGYGACENALANVDIGII